MEWVETTGRTIEEAKEAALDELGVDEIEAEFEIVEEPKAGLFGRVRKEARVRARIKPAKPRSKTPRRGKRRPQPSADSTDSHASETKTVKASNNTSTKSNGGGNVKKNNTGKGGDDKPRNQGHKSTKKTIENATGETVGATTGVTAEGQAEIVADFVRGLLDVINLEGTVSSEKVDDGIYEVQVAGDELGILIGPRGQTLRAVQDLGRTVVQRRVQGGIEGRVHLDIGGYRKRRRDALERFTRDLAAEVIASGHAKSLEPMNPADRKVVHDTVNTIDGVVSKSEGEDDKRHVVITPDN